MNKLLTLGLPLLVLFVFVPIIVGGALMNAGNPAVTCQPAAAAVPSSSGSPGANAPGSGMLERTVSREIPDDDRLGLSATQWKRAAEIVAAGKTLGIPSHGMVVALAVALQESGLKVYANDGRGGDLSADQQGIEASLRLPHDAVGTDHGSLGVFQQQWPWWGSMSELMDPATSARKFYEALLKVPGWQSLPLTVAAQRVQRSAYPDAYADDELLARAVYAKLAGTPATDLYLASADLAECATQLAGANAGDGTMVFPVPANLADTDSHNWGKSGSSWSTWHTGTDFKVSCGTPVLAVHAGTVRIDTTESWSGSWLVKVSTGPSSLTTWYAHMEKVLVTDGQQVAAGQQIGEAGNQGNSFGCHLHLEVHLRNGSIYGPDNVDPSTWLADNVGKKTTDPACRFSAGLSDSHRHVGVVVVSDMSSRFYGVAGSQAGSC